MRPREVLVSTTKPAAQDTAPLPANTPTETVPPLPVNLPREHVHPWPTVAGLLSTTEQPGCKAGCSSSRENIPPLPANVPRESIPRKHVHARPEPQRRSDEAAERSGSPQRPATAAGVLSTTEQHGCEAGCTQAHGATAQCCHGLKAVTIKQPFASAIMSQRKRVENRTWGHARARPILKEAHRHGRWLAVHAGSKSAEKSHRTLISALREKWPTMPEISKMPSSAILGFMHVSKVVSVAALQPSDPQAVGPYCWVIDHVVQLSTPHACSGSLGLWDVPANLSVPVEVLAEDVTAMQRMMSHDLRSFFAPTDK